MASILTLAFVLLVLCIVLYISFFLIDLLLHPFKRYLLKSPDKREDYTVGNFAVDVIQAGLTADYLKAPQLLVVKLEEI